MQNNLEKLALTVSSIATLNDIEWAAFQKIWSPFSAGRKTLLTESGQQERYLYFVIEGVQRVFYQDAKGRDATLVFSYTGSFGGVLDSMFLEKPAAYSYETLTNSIFLRVEFAQLHILAEQYSNIKKFLDQGVLHAFSGILERLVQLQCFSAEDKFKALFSRSPHMLNLVPHKFLANYLGIDPTNFSKFVNRKLI